MNVERNHFRKMISSKKTKVVMEKFGSFMPQET